MYKKHEQLYDVENELTLWKYMDFSKFINIITTGCIWFNRIDSFEDVYEGVYPPANKCKRKDVYGDLENIPQKIYDDMELYVKKRLYISCFHQNDYESAAMWNLYAKENGIAIKTTAQRLKNCFCNEEKDIEISKVAYIDYNEDFMPEGNLFYWGLHKRKSFAHEREIRCLFLNQKEICDCPGVYIKVDIEELIEKIYISPYAPIYVQSTLNELLKKFEFDVTIIRSPLYNLNK